MTTIIHHSHCSKSNAALELIKEYVSEVEILDYLNGGLSKERLKETIQLLAIKPEQLVRKNEQIYKEQFQSKICSDEEWLEILFNHPILIERPIIIHKGKAVIGRPLEAVITLLEE